MDSNHSHSPSDVPAKPQPEAPEASGPAVTPPSAPKAQAKVQTPGMSPLPPQRPYKGLFIAGTLLCIVGGTTLGISLMSLFDPPFHSHRKPASEVCASQVGWSLWENSKDLYRRFRWSIQQKVNRIYQLDEANAHLQLENAKLRQSLGSLQFHQASEKQAQLTQTHSEKLVESTGNKAGRIIEGIKYRPSEKLLPFQLYTLGIAYLREQEYEKAAVIFTLLLEKEERSPASVQFEAQSEVQTESLRDAKTLLAAGVAWYRLDNYVLADEYFTESLKKAQTETRSEDVQSQLRLWKALVSSKLNKGLRAKYWLNDLFEHHPKSQESTLMNQKAAALKKKIGRSKASQMVDHAEVHPR